MKLPIEHTHKHPYDDLLKRMGLLYYKIPYVDNLVLNCIVNPGKEWEQVSVTVSEQGERPVMCPSWEIMCFVKDFFFNKEEVAVQYHPAEADYISNHPFCLHLFRSVKVAMPLPPSGMIGVKELNGKF